MEPTELIIGDEARELSAYIWEPVGKPVSIEIDLKFVDRLGIDVMRAYGAVPHRGLEIGGILLGSADSGEKLTAKIEDFEPVLSKHESGPSYTLSGKGHESFLEALQRWQPQPGRQMRAIGFYRSHTREGLSLSEEDLELLSRYFSESSDIALLIKPFATRPPLAGLFFREEGAIKSDSSYMEFPFRRRELGGGEPERNSVSDRHFINESDAPTDASGGLAITDSAFGASSSSINGKQQLGLDDIIDRDKPMSSIRSPKLRGGWVWIPLSFIFLLLGTVLGFQVALSVRSQVTNTPQQDPYELSLTASPSADSVHLRWDRQSPAIRRAQRGVLVINDSGTEKTVELDVGHLRNGSVIYRRATDDVQFRLEIFTKQKVSVSETIEFQAGPVDDNGSEIN